MNILLLAFETSAVTGSHIELVRAADPGLRVVVTREREASGLADRPIRHFLSPKPGVGSPMAVRDVLLRRLDPHQDVALNHNPDSSVVPYRPYGCPG
jgi:hypothetical protein